MFKYLCRAITRYSCHRHFSRSNGRRFRYSFVPVYGFAWILLSSKAQAGMPGAYLLITELGKRRLEEISFFFVAFLLLTAIVRWLWNGLARDFASLPRLSYRGAICFTILWGLALTVVLSLVSGARELMTPAAWEPNGITYRLAQPNPAENDSMPSKRRERIVRVKESLWKYAAEHEGRFPTAITELPSDDHIADHKSGLSYVLVSALTLSSPRAILLEEPDIYSDRMALLTDGSVIELLRESEVSK